jgi:hypothetical protein
MNKVIKNRDLFETIMMFGGMLIMVILAIIFANYL